jgi:hypothetical protein
MRICAFAHLRSCVCRTTRADIAPSDMRIDQFETLSIIVLITLIACALSLSRDLPRQ